MDIALFMVGEGSPITKPSNFTGFCKKYNDNCNSPKERCLACHLKSGTATKEGKIVVYKCHAGLTSFAIPIMLKGKHMGSFLGGQVLLEPVNEKRFNAIVKELGINPRDYISEYQQIQVMSMEKLKAITDLLSAVINAIPAVAYANHKLSNLGSDYKMLKNIALEEWFLSNYESDTPEITDREFEILKLIVQGKSNVEIAKELFISVHTVKSHVSAILEKFSVGDRVQVAVKAVREGLI